MKMRKPGSLNLGLLSKITRTNGSDLGLTCINFVIIPHFHTFFISFIALKSFYFDKYFLWQFQNVSKQACWRLNCPYTNLLRESNACCCLLSLSASCCLRRSLSCSFWLTSTYRSAATGSITHTSDNHIAVVGHSDTRW